MYGMFAICLTLLSRKIVLFFSYAFWSGYLIIRRTYASKSKHQTQMKYLERWNRRWSEHCSNAHTKMFEQNETWNWSEIQLPLYYFFWTMLNSVIHIEMGRNITTATNRITDKSTSSNAKEKRDNTMSAAEGRQSEKDSSLFTEYWILDILTEMRLFSGFCFERKFNVIGLWECAPLVPFI